MPKLDELSHSLNTPLHIILGFKDILMDSELSGEQRACLRSIERAALELADSVAGVLETAAPAHRVDITR